ncbi:hypothetical protein DM01DRAFT_1124548 [Hesseltinella vesiculosa]|uniref:Uncharacterized protein n=1 Tax=Hesseltinella vesiculosa TaxID=101127 RepID=A0A1X2GU40_9FUNG|nr:hypothetical protein DM01DRAFT_1124548 [Hesseltinella vesiculosa]
MTKHKKKTKKHASSSVEAVVPAADTDDQPRSPSPDVATVPSSKVQADASPEAIDNTTEEVIAEPSIESVVQSSTEMVADESALNNNYNDPSYNDQQVPDLLSGLLKKQAEKAPKTWEEFCRASFDIYHRIRTWKLEQGAILGNLAWRQDELTEFAKDYIELIELYLSNKVEEDERAETLKKHLPAAILCVKMYIENAGTICLGQLRDWLADSENLDAPPVELGVANRLGWPFIQM